MRGKRVSTSPLLERAVNIPAYAGKTYPLGGMSVANWEHPRVCGENVTLPGSKTW